MHTDRQTYKHIHTCIHTYIHTWLISPLKGGSQDKAEVDLTLPSPSEPCTFVGENTEEQLPRPFASSLFIAFYEPQGIR